MSFNCQSVLLELVKVGFLENDSEKLKKELDKVADWKELDRLIMFHAIRPVAAEAFRKLGFSTLDNKYIQSYLEYSQIQTFQNLRYSNFIKGLLIKFEKEKIRVLLYKGNLFIFEFFQNRQLREGGDIDLLFHPDDISKGLTLLLDEGFKCDIYNPIFRNLTKNELLEKILMSEGKYEVPLEKDRIHLDIHWELNSGFLPYSVNYLSFFNYSQKKDFYGANLNLPDAEAIFWMLILHHGGKEFWVKYKHFVDLIAFMNTYGEILDWSKILESAKAFKLYNITLLGFYFLKKHFSFSLPQIIEDAIAMHKFNNIEKIEKYWTFAKPWNTLFPRLKYEQILVAQQDEGFSKLKYFKNIYKEYSKPNPLEQGRVISFPNRFTFLNFCSKVLTYLFKKLF
ncbi:hypothetical protein EGI22_06820 [Lacihabitans sp. LS3-19]|uniref:nucleotidyltransferase family protein n=1 Tax=Lacihabitans sp. LS3-19 TaxID=2487335 RepID=UPI0020CD752D|nr:nucleotidyltransferase family protein [Lacihabitans sp. LS3-19]MCP9767619.1 hypothetical protein [Lacihabitans sp. LS3-19]